MRLKHCSLISLINNVNAKSKIILFDKESENNIFNGYTYQFYDFDMEKSIEDYYIDDMIIDFDGFRIIVYKKYK